MPGQGQRHGAWSARRRAIRDYLVARDLLGSSISALAALVLVIALILIAVSPWVRHQLALSFTRAPDTYTELYFAGPEAVSTNTIEDQSQVIVLFVVTNHENGSTQYPYLVRVLDPTGQPAAQHSDSISVAYGETHAKRVALTLPAGTTWSTVEVKLLNRPETIRYTTPEARTPGN